MRADILKTLLLCVALVCTGAQAADVPTHRVTPNASDWRNAERGWFFYQDPPLKKKVHPLPAPAPAQKPAPVSKDVRCQTPNTWSVDCGFVDPGKNFEFQERERDALLQNMSLSKNDPKAVEAVQYYMRWMIQRASEVASNWYYNMVQNPALDPQVQRPISTFGLKLITEVDRNNASKIFAALKAQGAMLVYFSRNTCEFCHDMAPIVQRIAKQTGLELWDASLDDECLHGFESKCTTGATTLKPAEALHVVKVPTLFLFVPTKTWIRVSTGVTDAATIKSRIVSFFSAYLTAVSLSVKNGKGIQPPVDFSDTQVPSGIAKGAPAGEARVPSPSEIKQLLGK